MFERRYSFPTVDLALRTESRALDGALGSVFEHLGVHPTGDGAPPRPARVAFGVEIAEDGLEVPPDASPAPPLSAHVDVWEAPPFVYLSARCGSVVRVHAEAGRARGRVHPDLLGDPRGLWVKLFVFVVAGATLLLRRHGLYALHAAALGRGGRGALLVGDSDAGKSTLAYSLVREGWSYLSDDTVLLDSGGPAGTAGRAPVGVVPFRRRFGLDTVAGGVFPELAGGGHRSLAEEEKWVIDPARHFPGQAAERLTPAVLVLPQIVDADESRVEPVGSVEAHYALVRQSALVRLEPDAAAGQLAALSRLLGQTHHYRLLGGRDIVRRPARAAELLGPLLDRHPAAPRPAPR